ncbi:MAG: hypothetical protein P8Y45_09050 [Exilibacterium sp.]
MKMSNTACWQNFLALTTISIRQQLASRYWLVLLLIVGWPLIQVLRLSFDAGQGAYTAANAQNTLIGFPIIILAMGLGVQIITGCIEQNTLETTYTVPGKTYTIWLAEMVAATVLMISSELILALITALFFTSFPIATLVGALQSAVFYLALFYQPNPQRVWQYRKPV